MEERLEQILKDELIHFGLGWNKLDYILIYEKFIYIRLS